MVDPQIKRRPRQAAAGLPESLPPLIRQLYADRGITDVAQTELGAAKLARPAQLAGMARATALLADALAQQRRIIIIGDFDADGATSTALCMLALSRLGAQQVDFLVPNRFEYGYGLTPEIVAEACRQGADLLLTVDNGISCHAGVEYAKAQGLTVVISDHHLPGEQLPCADAIVNPNLPDCPFPSKALAGVGVAFYLMSALRAELATRGWFAQQQLAEPNLAELLDLVALGTVADVVPLDHNNRILVHQGLQRIRAGRCRPGIRAIVDVARRALHELHAIDLGFVLGPRLNAAGRLDDMSLGIRCLLTDDESTAEQLAAELDLLNRERRTIELGMKQEAERTLASLQLGDAIPEGICLYQPDWHQGVIGIVAARIKERYHRPTIVFADGGDGELIKGSARSIEGVHIRDLLERLNGLHPGLIVKFGGHAMAAGLTIARARFNEFSSRFNALIAATVEAETLQAVVQTDGALSADLMTLDTVTQIAAAGPWGQQFPEPLFDGVFKLAQQRRVGENHLKMVLVEPISQIVLDAIAFNVDTEQWPNPDVQQVQVAYRLSRNEFRGQVSLQLMVHTLLRA